MVLMELETLNENIEFIEFPQGEDVQVGGYNGELKLLKGNRYAPEKVSVWEFGVAKNVKLKLIKILRNEWLIP